MRAAIILLLRHCQPVVARSVRSACGVNYVTRSHGWHHSGHLEPHVLPCHGGIGKTGAIVAFSAGMTTVGVRLRFWIMADGILLFWPFSSNVIALPIMTCLAILVARIAFISSGPLAVPARLKPSAAIRSASKVNPTLKHSTAKR